MKDNFIAIIMAGGRGERFWPASREKKPKQFLKITSENTMIKETVMRLDGLIDINNIFIVTGKNYKEMVLNEIKGIPETNVLCEPKGMNTANAIALASAHIEKKKGNPIVTVLSADHLIKAREEFQKVLSAGYEMALKKDCLLTIGVEPKRPETGYGYIQKGEINDTILDTAICNVKQFKEKPDIDTAHQYIHSKQYLWNSGMFIWKNSFFMDEFNNYLPDNYIIINKIKDAIGTIKENELLNDLFPQLKNISVDYGVLEKSKNILCISAKFDWDDVGSWSSLYRHLEEDNTGNVIKGNAILAECSNCLAYSDDETLIGVIDLEDIMVIKSGNSILVCRKKDDQKVKNLLEAIKKKEELKNYV